MKRFFAVICISFLLLNVTFAKELPDVQLEMRGYDTVELPAGTFIPVMTLADISTEVCDEGYKVKFISTTDLYLHDITAVKQDTEFWGYVEKVNLPVVGTNASMKIKITKMVSSNGEEIPVKGYIYTDNNNLIGGEMSAPLKWVKMPHYQSKFKYTNLSLRPSQERAMGRHVGIKAGSNELIILTAPLEIINSLSD